MWFSKKKEEFNRVEKIYPEIREVQGILFRKNDTYNNYEATIKQEFDIEILVSTGDLYQETQLADIEITLELEEEPNYSLIDVAKTEYKKDFSYWKDRLRLKRNVRYEEQQIVRIEFLEE